MTAKKTEIRIETREIWTIRRAQPIRQVRQGWCLSCGAQVELITPEEAALVTSLGLREIFRQIEQAQVHFLETTAGEVLICLPSLLAEPSGNNNND